ncbi:GntR family transcriptional regulator YhfZ [Dubosiella muris]|uniref:GntR family transcriptional regulator n=1 Tax=Dubosiella muris TaxID=3038133 RepID=A0AC61R899_9FIRM|nr:GntR family transcriptional regulator YhfZ [Dubosiella muris]TGY66169.1 GntR family transcriptional regulator [Dubosiella muris]
MDIQNLLYSKNGLSTKTLAKRMLCFEEGERIPTVTELNNEIHLARGTVQNAIKLLQKSGAVTLEAHGQSGTILKKKDVRKLLEIAGISHILGVMPLPYSKRYEGLATGLVADLENRYDIPVSLAFMRGSKNRMSMVLCDRYDFAIVSRYAAEQMIEAGMDIEIVKSFGPYSYLSQHILAFHDPDVKEVVDGMKIGVDQSSVDQKKMTEIACVGKNVRFVNVEYTQILQKVMSGEIDAAVWNMDEIQEKLYDMNYLGLSIDDDKDTEAVIVVNRARREMVAIIDDLIHTNTVRRNQQLVMEGKLIPSY